MVLAPGEVGGRKKTPWITVPRLRVLFARLLDRRPSGLADLLEEVNEVLRRNEEARIYHWLKTHGKYPPSRRKPDS
jgi:hypothetical protein